MTLWKAKMHVWSTSYMYIYLAFDASGEALAFQPSRAVPSPRPSTGGARELSTIDAPDYPIPDGVARTWRTYQGIAQVPGETVWRSSSGLVSLAYKTTLLKQDRATGFGCRRGIYSRHIKITYLGQAMLYLHCPQRR
jgi:hypothetical protein